MNGIVSGFRDPRHADFVPLDLVVSGWGVRAAASRTALHATAGALRSRAGSTVGRGAERVI